jgi:hypothetical protein
MANEKFFALDGSQKNLGIGKKIENNTATQHRPPL